MRTIIGVVVSILLLSFLVSLCSPASGNFPGHEYMPDMAHPITYEANVLADYEWNHWDEKSVATKISLSQPRTPVNGTIPRGMTAVYYQGESALAKVRGDNAPNAISAVPNSYAPFYYGNSEEERTRATEEITKNPFSPTYAERQLMNRIDGLKAQQADLTEGESNRLDSQIAALEEELAAEKKKVLAKGKELYDIQCGICHGEKGDGAGYLARDGGPYPVAPANFLSDEFINSNEGRYYYAIMYGKNVMGAYKDKLSFEERWLVIRYIRSLQN